MKEKLKKAVFVAAGVAVGVALVMFIGGNGFSFLRMGLYAAVAFVVDYIFSCMFEKKKK